MNDLLDDYLFPRRTVIDGYMVNKVILTDATRGSREIRSDEVLRGRLESILNPDIGIRGQAKDLPGHYSITYDLLLNGEALRPVASRLGLTKPATLSDLEAYKSIVEFSWLEQAWDEHLENLRALKREVEALGATLLVVIFPDAVQVYDSLRPQQGNLQWEYPNQRLSEFFIKNRLSLSICYRNSDGMGAVAEGLPRIRRRICTGHMMLIQMYGGIVWLVCSSAVMCWSDHSWKWTTRAIDYRRLINS